MTAAFQKEHEVAAAKAESVLEAVKADLTKIGHGVESQPAHVGGNFKAAEIAFTNLAKLNVRYRAAFADVQNAKARLNAAESQQKESHAREQITRQYLKALARKAAMV